MPRLFQIKRRFFDNVLFEGEYDSLVRCVEAAVREGVSLRYADLSNSNLHDVDLSEADLRGADLSGSDLFAARFRRTTLRYVDLSNAVLRNADLYSADLSGAELHNTDLSYANFFSCTGNRLEVRSVAISEDYSIVYTAEVMQIGCEQHAIADWWEFDDKRILKMDGKKALKFWRGHKDLLKKLIELNPATKQEKE